MVNAYIANGGSSNVSVIDTVSNTVVSTISVGINPTGVAVSYDGNSAYVTNAGSNTLSVISTQTNSLTNTIAIGGVPTGVAVTPSGNKLYAVNSADNTVSVINPATNSVITTISVGSEPMGIAITPNGSSAYVANAISNTVSVINIASNTVSTSISVGNGPWGICISPNGGKVYVANNGAGTVSVIDTSTNSVSATITVGTNPCGIIITPNGNSVYVANHNSGTVSVINTSTNTVSTTITVGTGPYGISVTPDGGKIYAVNQTSNTVSIIDTSTNTVSSTITVGSTPRGLGQFIQQASTPMTSVYTAPQGRLTLTSNTPVMTTDATAQTSVYYTPYQGNIVPIYDGANTQSYAFGQLTMALNTSNQLSGNLYDLFVFLNSSVVTIGAGPAWSSSSSRGTGAGTTQLQQINGLWTNANSITLKNGATSYSSVAAGQATYVGSVYMTANGQTSMMFKPAAAAGGSNNVIGLWNAYNRVRISSLCADSNVAWTYNVATWRKLDNSANNRITYVDGLGQSFIRARIATIAYNAIASNGCWIGVVRNSTTAAPERAGAYQSTTNSATGAATLSTEEGFPPSLGLNYIQGMENSPNASVVTFAFNGNQTGVFFEGEC